MQKETCCFHIVNFVCLKKSETPFLNSLKSMFLYVKLIILNGAFYCLKPNLQLQIVSHISFYNSHRF